MEAFYHLVSAGCRFLQSQADAFCAALAKGSGFPLVAGDPEFHVLEGTIQIEWLGAPPAQ